MTAVASWQIEAMSCDRAARCLERRRGAASLANSALVDAGVMRAVVHRADACSAAASKRRGG
ncbi:hypothetical protein IB69_008005 [Xanthomonas citri]|nr:hypothetical protein IB69_008005 [Xanthomonas citri]